jgi:bacteriorhodopsin
MWVIFVECIAYAAAFVSPDEDFVSIHLTNGMWVEWMRYAGWILTCPVLLMTLVSMTTEDGTKAPTVRLVPLLVANLTMVLLGITAAANLQPVKWYVFAMALCFGGHVFSSAIQCFLALYEGSPNGAVRKTSLWLCLTFLAGWGCFPCAFLAGHSGTNIITTEMQWALFVIGDMLSKNCWVGLAVLRQHQLDRYTELQMVAAVGDVEMQRGQEGKESTESVGTHSGQASSSGDSGGGFGGGAKQSPPGAQRVERRGSNSCIIIDEINGGRSNHSAGGSTWSSGQSRAREIASRGSRAAGSAAEKIAAKANFPASPDGEAADLQVLKSVLARYHAMPAAEREALVPVFAAMLSEQAEQPYPPAVPPSAPASKTSSNVSSRREQSNWLDRQMDEPGA